MGAKTLGSSEHSLWSRQPLFAHDFEKIGSVLYLQPDPRHFIRECMLPPRIPPLNAEHTLLLYASQTPRAFSLSTCVEKCAVLYDKISELIPFFSARLRG